MTPDLQLVIDALHHEARLHGHDCRLHREGAVALLDALAGPPVTPTGCTCTPPWTDPNEPGRWHTNPECPVRVGAAPPEPPPIDFTENPNRTLRVAPPRRGDQ